MIPHIFLILFALGTRANFPSIVFPMETHDKCVSAGKAFTTPVQGRFFTTYPIPITGGEFSCVDMETHEAYTHYLSSDNVGWKKIVSDNN